MSRLPNPARHTLRGQRRHNRLGSPLGEHRLCSVCAEPADIPFDHCRFCNDRPSMHHGRCCAGKIFHKEDFTSSPGGPGPTHASAAAAATSHQPHTLLRDPISWQLMDFTLLSGAFGSRAILWRIGHVSRSAVLAATLCDEASGLWAYCGDLCELGRVFIASVPFYRCFQWRRDILKHQHGLLFDWWQNGCSLEDREDEYGSLLPGYRRNPRSYSIEDIHEYRARSGNPGFRNLEQRRDEAAYLGCDSPSSSAGS